MAQSEFSSSHHRFSYSDWYYRLSGVSACAGSVAMEFDRYSGKTRAIVVGSKFLNQSRRIYQNKNLMIICVARVRMTRSRSTSSPQLWVLLTKSYSYPSGFESDETESGKIYYLIKVRELLPRAARLSCIQAPSISGESTRRRPSAKHQLSMVLGALRAYLRHCFWSAQLDVDAFKKDLGNNHLSCLSRSLYRHS